MCSDVIRVKRKSYNILWLKGSRIFYLFVKMKLRKAHWMECLDDFVLTERYRGFRDLKMKIGEVSIRGIVGILRMST